MKCICCKFDNCRVEFLKHRSNTSFDALSRQFDVLSVLLRDLPSFADRVCEQHRLDIVSWIDYMFKFYDSMKEGVHLPKIRRSS